MLFFLVLIILSCAKPNILDGYDEDQLLDKWWQLEVDNNLVENYINETYGYPVCFFLDTNGLAFILNQDYELWEYTYKIIEKQKYLINNSTEITISKIDSNKDRWHLELKENMFKYEGYAYSCTFM
tara:strand:- start:79 stop:456 length:378 start_codon:yes stop_codon:yes gene_type:complete